MSRLPRIIKNRGEQKVQGFCFVVPREGPRVKTSIPIPMSLKLVMDARKDERIVRETDAMTGFMQTGFLAQLMNHDALNCEPKQSEDAIDNVAIKRCEV